MVTFITWNKSDDSKARQSFKDITDITVQSNPRENLQETHFMVGAKITLQQYQELNETELFTLKNSTPPSWWEDKPEDVILES